MRKVRFAATIVATGRSATARAGGPKIGGSLARFQQKRWKIAEAAVSMSAMGRLTIASA